MHIRFIISALILLSLLITGCAEDSSSGSISGSVGRTGQLGGLCNPDDTCDTGLECDSGVCRRPHSADGDPEGELEPECTIDLDCDPSERCDDGTCVPRGTEDGDLDGEEIEHPDAEQEIEAEAEEEIPTGPQLSYEPAIVDFGSVPVEGSSNRMITIRNIGEGDLEIDFFAIPDGVTPQGTFSIETFIPTPKTLQPGEFFDASLIFERMADGQAEALLVINSNDIFALSHEITLTSAFVGEVDLAWAPEEVEFGGTPLGVQATANLTIRNLALGESAGTLTVYSAIINDMGEVFSIGDGAADFPVDIPPEGELEIPLEAVVDAAEIFNGALRITHNDPAKTFHLYIPLSVYGIVPDLRVTPSPVNFGQVPMDEGRSIIVELSNGGGIPVEVSGAELGSTGNGVFELLLDPDVDGADNLPAVIPLEGHVDIAVHFAPQTVTGYTGRLLIYSNSYTSLIHQVELSGDGLPPALEISPNELDFGCVLVGTEVTRNVEVSYSGEGEVIIADATLSDPPFMLLNSPNEAIILSADDVATFELSFSPSREQENFSSELEIALGPNGDVPLRIPVFGCGVAPRIDMEFDGDTNFIEVQVLPKPMHEMTEAERALWIARGRAAILNTGTAPMNVSSVEIEEPSSPATWIIEADVPAVIQPNESLAFDILWGPTALAMNSIDIVVCSDAFGLYNIPGLCEDGSGHLPFQLRIEKTPISPLLGVYPSEIDFGYLGPGQSTTETVYIRNWGANSPLRISSISIPNSDEMTVESVTPEAVQEGWMLSGSPSEIIIVTVRFAPVSGFMQGAALVIRHNDKDAVWPDISSEETVPAYPEYNVYLTGNGGANAPPVAVLQTPPGEDGDHGGTRSITIDVGNELVMSGGNSYDPDEMDHIAGYSWSIDQDEGYSNDTSLATYTFNDSGDYTVRLTVFDNNGANSLPLEDSRLEVSVQGDPVAVATERDTGDTDVTALVRRPLLLDGSESSDADGYIVSYRWFVRSLPDGPDTPFSSDPQPSYVFSASGDYIIGLEVEDNDGRVSGRSEIDVQVLDNDSLKLEFTWTGNGYVALHYIRPDGAFGTENDCNADNDRPDWSASGHGYPEHRQILNFDEVVAEIVEHPDPGDGAYAITAQYVEVGRHEVYKEVCDMEANCTECGCTCALCWLVGCCDVCEVCRMKWVEEDAPAELTFKFYLNGEQEPEWIVEEPSYALTEQDQIKSFNLFRVEGSFISPW